MTAGTDMTLAACDEFRFGFERIAPEQHRARHLRRAAYATVVLEGSFVQTGYGGRYLVEAGDVVVQPTWDRHANRMISSGIDIVRLPWPFDAGSGGVWRGCEVDGILRIAESNVSRVSALLREMVSAGRQTAPLMEHCADQYFADLLKRPRLEVQDWAVAHAITREALSRSVQRLYGASPTDIRCELRARAALRLCVETPESLASVALEAGYADQAHMTRSLRSLTDASPAEWRRAAESRR